MFPSQKALFIYYLFLQSCIYLGFGNRFPWFYFSVLKSARDFESQEFSAHLEPTMNVVRRGHKLSLRFCTSYICTNEEFNLSANTISLSYLTANSSQAACDPKRSLGSGEPEWTRSVLTFYLCFCSQCAASRVQLNACWERAGPCFWTDPVKCNHWFDAHCCGWSCPLSW